MSLKELKDKLASRGQDIEAIKTALKNQKIETPSWAYSNSGTRFQTFTWPGAAGNIYQKIDDAAIVHKFSGVAPGIAIHIPWDKVADYRELKEYAEAKAIKIGAVNPNLFQEKEYRLGSLAHPKAEVREMALEHIFECIEVMKETGSKDLSLWFADGSNYAGQDDFRKRKNYFFKAFKKVYDALPDGKRMLIEYKFFEPSFYHTDLPDWGMAYSYANKLGNKADVLVDMGHHAQGTNIEHIVAFLLDENKLGGFHFNNRKYADDDLIVGSVNPFELFSVFHELVKAENSSDPAVVKHAKNIAYMLDQNHNIEGKIAAVIQSIINVQIAYAKALLVDQSKLEKEQNNGDVLAAHQTLLDAYQTDVRPLLAQVRKELGRDPDPIKAYWQSGYEAKIAGERGTANAGGTGFE